MYTYVSNLSGQKALIRFAQGDLFFDVICAGFKAYIGRKIKTCPGNLGSMDLQGPTSPSKFSFPASRLNIELDKGLCGIAIASSV